MNLYEFLARLGQLKAAASLETLQQELRSLSLSVDEIPHLTSFHPDRYMRNRIGLSQHFEALLLCFEAGQRTPIHDHAGSACGVKVLEGVATETIFDRTPDGWLFATESNALRAGGVVGSNDMDTHQLSNLQTAGKRLVTLHIYSPPLGTVGNYSLVDNQVHCVQAAVQDLVPIVQAQMADLHLPQT